MSTAVSEAFPHFFFFFHAPGFDGEKSPSTNALCDLMYRRYGISTDEEEKKGNCSDI